MKDDWSLLREFAQTRSQQAFTTLVRRHVDMVYAACLRELRNGHDAEDATQAVFIVLARKAGSISRGTVVAAWLYRTARFVASRLSRANRRKKRHETAAAEARGRQEDAMRSQRPGAGPAAGPAVEELDLALGRLGRRERAAVLLRFFEGRSYEEVAAELGVSAEAAKKQVQRAVRRLRELIGGAEGGAVAALGDAALASALSSALRPAPPHLHDSILHAALARGGAAGAGAALAKGAMLMMTLARIKLIAGCVLLAVAAGAATLWAVEAARPVECAVTDASGESVAGASVEFGTGEVPVQAYATPGLNSLRVDAKGRFPLPANLKDVWVVVKSDRGFGRAPAEELAKTHRLVLGAWGSIEGTVKIGKEKAAGQTISVIGRPNFDVKFIRPGVAANPVSFELVTKSDAEGHFRFPRVAPGEWIVARVPPLLGYQFLSLYPEPVTVEPGKRLTMTLGGTGRAVVGRVVPAGGNVKFDPENYIAGEICLVPPPIDVPPGVTREQYPAAAKKWILSPAGKEYRLAFAHSYKFAVAADGAFRVDDLPARKYALKIDAGRGAMMQFTVPDMPLGYSETPLNLGDLPLK